MTAFHAIFLGGIQGLTEFLPISSSGHLILLPYFMGWPDQGIAFDIAAHLGSLIAVTIYFREDLRKILSHSVMPWVDSVQVLAEFAQLNNINSDQWHLVTGEKDKIYQLARNSYFADEGFGKSITSNEDFLHTENILLIDQQRRIRGIYNGTIRLDMLRLIDDIHTLL